MSFPLAFVEYRATRVSPSLKAYSSSSCLVERRTRADAEWEPVRVGSNPRVFPDLQQAEDAVEAGVRADLSAATRLGLRVEVTRLRPYTTVTIYPPSAMKEPV